MSEIRKILEDIMEESGVQDHAHLEAVKTAGEAAIRKAIAGRIHRGSLEQLLLDYFIQNRLMPELIEQDDLAWPLYKEVSYRLSYELAQAIQDKIRGNNE